MAIFIQAGEQLAECGEPVAQLNNSFDNLSGISATTEDDDTLVGVGEVSDISGPIITTEDDDTLIGVGSIGGISGPIIVTEIDDTTSTAGIIGNIAGVIATTEDDDTMIGIVSIAQIRVNPMLSFLNVIKHLLPNARAWRITVNKQLRQFFDGLSGTGDDVKQFYDEIWTDINPQETRELDAWDTEFGLRDTGLTEQERRNRLDAAWKALGGQDPRYIQDTLQGNGFDVYVHEWWVPGSEPAIGSSTPATPRNPNTVLVGATNFTVGCGEAVMECGEALAQSGERTGPAGYVLVNKDGTVYSITADPATWPYYLYIGGVVFGDAAQVDSKRRDEFEDLCLKICPAQQWLGIIVEYN